VLKEFKEFISRGNVIDLAVGIIIGAAFTGVVNSLVADVIMPVIGVLTGGLDFSNYFQVLKMDAPEFATLKAAKDAGIPVLSYGIFINAIVNFLIVSAAIFVLVKQVNKLKKAQSEAPAAPVAPTRSEVLLQEIRDALAKK